MLFAISEYWEYVRVFPVEMSTIYLNSINAGFQLTEKLNAALARSKKENKQGYHAHYFSWHPARVNLGANTSIYNNLL